MINRTIAVVVVSAFFVAMAQASAQTRPFNIFTKLSAEYDDNIRETDQNASDSMKLIAEVEFVGNMRGETAILSLRYKPAVTWWDNRDEDSVDLHHDLDVLLFNRLSERLSFNARNKFRYAELPEAIEGGTVVRQESDFIYNEAAGAVMMQVAPVVRFDVSADYKLLRYQDSAVADRNDYDKISFGAGYRYNLVPETTLGAVVGWEIYDSADRVANRSADTYSVGAVVDHMFSPEAQVGVGLGYMTRDYDLSGLSSDSSPYADIRLTLAPSPATRLSLGLGYSLLEADIFPFVSRERLALSVSVSHDVTARINVGAALTYARSDYESDNAIQLQQPDGQPFPARDGSEDSIISSLRVSYQLNVSNWIEAAWYLTSLDSDLREDFERNRLNIGWRSKF
jgi:hypothetical protein